MFAPEFDICFGGCKKPGKPRGELAGISRIHNFRVWLIKGKNKPGKRRDMHQDISLQLMDAQREINNMPVQFFTMKIERQAFSAVNRS
jgi:hypothetical protein